MPSWHTTDNIDVALSCGYIGEAVIAASLVTQGVNIALHGEIVMPKLMFYCGAPDDRLKEMFGYA